MTSNMAKSQKKIVEGDCSVDRISSLPENVIECIMNSMPTRDAARTCVLSSRWRYVWADHPSLVLDQHFWDDIKRDRLPDELVIDYPNIVSKILLHHVGYIRTFVILVSSVLSSMPHVNIDLWLSSLCRRGLKELRLEIFGRNHYKVPCSVFSSSELIHLNLRFCIIKSGCFTNIQTLNLRKVTFDSSVVLTTPLLTSLVVYRCCGIIHFDISAPRLESLILHHNDDLNLKPFLTCTGIDYAFLLSSGKEKTYFEGCESFCLVKLLAAWPGISKLVVDGFCFKYLATGSIPCILDQLNLRYFSIRDLKLDSEPMAWILCILKNSPLLHKFEISFGVTDLNGGMTDNIDESRCNLDFRLDELHTVIMKGFTATPNEHVLAMILLHCAPVLEKMLVDENDEVDPKEQVRIVKNLLSLQHAFPKTRIVFGSCSSLKYKCNCYKKVCTIGMPNMWCASCC